MSKQHLSTTAPNEVKEKKEKSGLSQDEIIPIIKGIAVLYRLDQFISRTMESCKKVFDESELGIVFDSMKKFHEKVERENKIAQEIVDAMKKETLEEFDARIESTKITSGIILQIAILSDKQAQEAASEKINERIESGIKQKQKEIASLGGKAKGEKNKGKKQKIIQIWLSGKYDTRDICAEEEYATLKFKSFRMARNALINTPNPESKKK